MCPSADEPDDGVLCEWHHGRVSEEDTVTVDSLAGDVRVCKGCLGQWDDHAEDARRPIRG